MFLIKKFAIIKSTVFVFCLNFSTVSLSQEECRRDLTLEMAKLKVEAYKKRYNVGDYYKYDTSLIPTNGECHYYYYERVKTRELHANRYYFLAGDGEVLYLGRRLRFKPGMIKCPTMKKHEKEYFFDKINTHVSVENRKVSFVESKLQVRNCMYNYSAEFEDKLIPSAINYTFDYKGRMFNWTPVNEVWRKREKELDKEIEETERLKREKAKKDKK